LWGESDILSPWSSVGLITIDKRYLSMVMAILEPMALRMFAAAIAAGGQE
jgi:hypothetical protein